MTMESALQTVEKQFEALGLPPIDWTSPREDFRTIEANAQLRGFEVRIVVEDWASVPPQYRFVAKIFDEMGRRPKTARAGVPMNDRSLDTTNW